MLSKIFPIVFVGVLIPLISDAQTKESKYVDSVVLNINQQLAEQTHDSLYINIFVSDSVLEQFIVVHPEFSELFKQGDTLHLPLVKFAVLNKSVVRVDFSENSLQSVSFQFIDESLVKVESIDKKYIGPSAMSTCSGGLYQSSTITYYKNNWSIRTFFSGHPCLGFGYDTQGHIESHEYLPELIKRRLDFTYILHEFILKKE